MRTEFLCVSVLRVASGSRVKLASCKSALNPPVVYSTDRSKAVVPVLVLLFVALWFILRGDLLYVFPCVILFLCFSVLLVLRLPRLGKREQIFVIFVRLFDLCLFGFVGFLFLLGSGKGCSLHNLWSCQKVCDALVYLLDNIFIRFGTKLYRQTVGIRRELIVSSCCRLFLFCYERDFMKSLSRENQADIIEAFNSTSRYLDDLLNINNIYFDQMADRIYPTELQLNRANSSDTEAPFLDLNLCISIGTVSTKIYDKRDDFDFDIVNFPFLDGDVSRRTSYGVYISQLIR